MEKKMIVHKIEGFKNNRRGEFITRSVCGCFFYVREECDRFNNQWKKVTCKNCLKGRN